MKVLLLLTLMALVSCGQHEGESTMRLGQVRTVAPIALGSENVTRLTTLCNALTQKVQQLALTTTASMTFDVRESQCGGTVVSSRQPAEVKGTAPAFFFSKTDEGHVGEAFVFYSIETNQSGVMGTICGSLSNPTVPLVNGGKALWFSTVSTRDCVAGTNEMCIFIETGLPTGKADEYKITGEDWMKFQLNPGHPRYGYFIDRKTLSSAGCADDKLTEIRTQLID